MFRLKVSSLAKRFGPRQVFTDISFDLTTGQSLAVIGPNGSGKTTLLMTLLAGLRPTRGEITYYHDGAAMDADQVRTHASLVSPYFHLYDSLTAEENLKFFATVSGYAITGKQVDSLLARVGLEGRGMDLVGEYSSGMKQRLKYATGLLKKPAFLFLDEPSSNLDEEGKRTVRDIIEECRDSTILVIATNEQEEYGLASQLCRVSR
ncbi:MAG TPA: ABC transporter ATP-binding protein [Acidobacteriota bacterium]|nr:ABC transporter ATP-binding protein [Acidobacteriota bacterium]